MDEKRGVGCEDFDRILSSHGCVYVGVCSSEANSIKPLPYIWNTVGILLIRFRGCLS